MWSRLLLLQPAIAWQHNYNNWLDENNQLLISPLSDQAMEFPTLFCFQQGLIGLILCVKISWQGKLLRSSWGSGVYDSFKNIHCVKHNNGQLVLTWSLMSIGWRWSVISRDIRRIKCNVACKVTKGFIRNKITICSSASMLPPYLQIMWNRSGHIWFPKRFSDFVNLN